MKIMKRMAALLLALCLLVGLPMAVQAVGSSAPESFRILKVVEMPDSMATAFGTTQYPGNTIKGKTVLVYFNSTMSAEMQAKLPDMVYRIHGQDKDGNGVSSVDGTLRYVSGTNPIALYTSARTIDAWREYDATATTIHVSLSEGTWVNGSQTSAKANKVSDVYVNEAGQYLDYYADDVTYCTSYGDAVRSMAIEQETDMLTMIAAEKAGSTTVNVYFSEPIAVNAADMNTKYTVWLSIMDANNTLIRSNTGSYDGSVNTETTTAGKMVYQWQMKSMDISVDGRTMILTTDASRITNAFSSWEKLTTNYPNAGYSLKLRIEETEKLDAALGEVAANYFIDAIWGKETNSPLYVNCAAKNRAIVDLAGEALAATRVNNTTVKLTFSQAVRLMNHEAIMVGGQPVKSVEPVGTVPTAQYLLTVADGVDISTSEVSVVIPVGAFAMTKASEVTLDTAEDTAVDKIVLDENTTYNFMNADTGRVLAVGEIDELTPENVGHNLYAFKINDQYVDLTSGAPELTDTKIVYGLRACANDRYQIVIGNGVVADTDEDSTNTASLALKADTSMSIATGWYLTEKDGQRPLKVLPFGDSITYGVNSDVEAAGGLQIGWRDTVSQELLTYFNGRVVFVGPEKSIDTTLTDNILLRHAGYPGWVVDGSAYTTGKKGLASLTKDIKTKYVPDVTLLMIGTNDLGELQGNGLTDEELTGLMTRYEELVTSIAPTLEENGAVFASKLTPRQRDDLDANVVRFNEKLESTVKSLQSKEYAVYLNDNHTGFPTDAENQGWCNAEYAAGNGLHLNDNGDAFVASRYVGMVKLYYGQDGLKRSAKITAQVNGAFYATLDDAMEEAANTGAEIDLLDNVDVTEENVFVLDADVTLDLNGYALSAKNVMAFGHIIDSTKGCGKLVIDSTARTSLLPNNKALPLYDAENGCYRFYTYEVNVPATGGVRGTAADTVSFGVQLIFANTEAYDLLAKDDKVEVRMDLSVTKNDKDTKFYFAFKPTTLATYAEEWNGEDADGDLTTKPTLILNVSGVTGVSAISCTPGIYSATDVFKIGTTLDYSATATE